MDVLVFGGGERQRLKLPRNVRKLLHDRPHERPPEQLAAPLVEKRLYLPEGVVAQRDVQTAVEDLVALLCLYLVQEELVRLEDDGSVREWLYAYFHRFKGARQLGVDYALGEIVTRYQIPEDYRALRKYVAKTISGLRTNQRRREGMDPRHTRVVTQMIDLSGCHDDAEALDDREEPMSGRRPDHTRPMSLEPFDRSGPQMIPEAAVTLGMSERYLYELVAQKKIRTETVTYGRRQYLAIPEAEVERIKVWLEEKRWRKDLIEGLAEAAHITIASARRWMERQVAQGLGREAIIQRLRERLQRPKRGKETEE
jgi:hypothetical protein